MGVFMSEKSVYVAQGLDQQGRQKTGVHVKPDSTQRVYNVIFGGVVTFLGTWFVVALIAKAVEVMR